MQRTFPKTRGVICEVCIDSVASAVAAEQGGANRVELCANLVEGGTTPSTGMIRSVLAHCSLPVMVMIRPRGGHFTYDVAEQEVMLREAEAVLAEPVAGLVIGALRSDGTIDERCCERLCALAGARSVTFHRAFDQVADAQSALQILIDLQVDRVLTSGQATTALAGLPRLRELVAWAEQRISIMPGCGVRAENVAQILSGCEAHEIHFSGAELSEQPVEFWRTEIPMSAARTPGDLQRRVTSLATVRAICAAVRG